MYHRITSKTVPPETQELLAPLLFAQVLPPRTGGTLRVAPRGRTFDQTPRPITLQDSATLLGIRHIRLRRIPEDDDVRSYFEALSRTQDSCVPEVSYLQSTA